MLHKAQEGENSETIIDAIRMWVRLILQSEWAKNGLKIQKSAIFDNYNRITYFHYNIRKFFRTE